ncbi:MAG: hypothetical protein QM503_01145 [Bacteroidota bacterium]
MQKLKQHIVTITILILISSPVFSQTFQDFKKQIRKEYDTFEKETQQKFDTFVTKIDKEFSAYLSDSFGEYDIGHEKFEPSVQKPNAIPTVEEVVVSGNLIDFEVTNPIITYQGPVYPGIKKMELDNFEVQRFDIDFLGWPLYFDIDKAFLNIKAGKPSANEISSFWTKMSNVNYNHFLYQISEVANTLNVNQWGYYQLLKQCSQQIYPGDNNMQILFQWAMLSRSRYKVKVGFDSNHIFLLIPSIYNMYNIDFVTVGGINYYVMDGKGKQLQTYEKDFPESDILMDVSIKKPMYTHEIKKSKDFHFTHAGEKITVNLGYDEEMIRFYNTIPLSDISIYFNSVVSNRTKESILSAFKPILKGKDEVESANILLSFMQQAFGYKTDQYAYGVEKYFFADELLHYPYSDCEDRSVLFAYLIKTILKKDVVALGFPGHMAIAINFNQEVDGANFSYNNKTYVVADPTYYGAPVGILVSAVSGLKAEVIPLANNTNKAITAELIWDKITGYGGFKSDKLNDLIFDASGDIYVCGYFVENADFDGHVLLGNANERDIFIAKFDSELNLKWVSSATGSGNDLAFSLALASDGSIYVYGSVENELSFAETTITANNAPDVFVAKYTKNGELEWVQKAGIDKLDHSLDFMFAAKFNPQGEKIMAKLYSQAEDFNNYGLEIDNEGNALIVGSFFATAGMSSNDFVNYNIGTNLDVPEVLYETDIKLKENEYEATIAGLFSALNLLKANTIEIQGSQIKTTFDTYNNKFSSYASGIYENLGNMHFLKNEKGIITIKTINGDPIILDKIKIGNDARIRIVKYKSGNILVEVISGIYVGGGNYWLDMNSIKLFRETGDLLFDFDTDNSVKKLNLKKEILKH